MRSLPTVGRDRLVPIPGSPPNMIEPPSGCAFRVRCPHAIDKCAVEIPELRTVGDLESACLRADELRAVGS